MMRPLLTVVLIALIVAIAPPPVAQTADDTKVRQATRQVEMGARKIGEGKILEGVEDTAKGIGKTVVEGAKFTGEKFKEAGKAAEPKAKTTWEHLKAGAAAFGGSVKNFFTRLVSD